MGFTWYGTSSFSILPFPSWRRSPSPQVYIWPNGNRSISSRRQYKPDDVHARETASPHAALSTLSPLAASCLSRPAQSAQRIKSGTKELTGKMELGWEFRRSLHCPGPIDPNLHGQSCTPGVVKHGHEVQFKWDRCGSTCPWSSMANEWCTSAATLTMCFPVKVGIT